MKLLLFIYVWCSQRGFPLLEGGGVGRSGKKMHMWFLLYPHNFPLEVKRKGSPFNFSIDYFSLPSKNILCLLWCDENVITFVSLTFTGVKNETIGWVKVAVKLVLTGKEEPMFSAPLLWNQQGCCSLLWSAEDSCYCHRQNSTSLPMHALDMAVERH